MLFNFCLHKLVDSSDFMAPDAAPPGWFRLTDGYYWMNVGDTQIFRYSPEIIQHWGWNEHEAADPFVDYYIARLWDGVHEILPAILEPLPQPLVSKLASQEIWLDWQQQVQQRFAAFPENDEAAFDRAVDIIDGARGWWRERRLNNNYLSSGLYIWFWSDGTMMHIDWDNTDVAIDGVAVWAATRGRFSLSVSDFLNELKSFDDRFTAAMAERVNNIEQDWPRPDIIVDVTELQRQDTMQSAWLAEILKTAGQARRTDWDRVMDLMRQAETL